MTDSATHTRQAHHALALVMNGCRLPDVVAILVGIDGLSREQACAQALAAADFAATHYGLFLNEHAGL
jgi:hypothetical protein